MDRLCKRNDLGAILLAGIDSYRLLMSNAKKHANLLGRWLSDESERRAGAMKPAQGTDAFLEDRRSGTHDVQMGHETVRRRITTFLLALLATVSLRGGEAKDVALTLAPIAALLVPVMRFYFRRAGRGRGWAGGGGLGGRVATRGPCRAAKEAAEGRGEE
jgi:hypothetical protein